MNLKRLLNIFFLYSYFKLLLKKISTTQILPYVVIFTFTTMILYSLNKQHTNQIPICHKNILSIHKTQDNYFNKLDNLYYKQASWVYYLTNISDNLLFLPILSVAPSRLSEADHISLNSHIHKRLKRYESLFRRVAADYNMDWLLLAAISYQESHWSPRAKSPTGVRGLMMLTLLTADEVGIRNRLDPEQSLRGGVIYLNRIYHRLPNSILEPDRFWITLASYNMGIGHVYDARKFIKHRHGNPNKWEELKLGILSLEQPSHYQTTNYGYAKGSEAIRYVENIKLFYQHLLQNTYLTQSAKI